MLQPHVQQPQFPGFSQSNEDGHIVPLPSASSPSVASSSSSSPLDHFFTPQHSHPLLSPKCEPIEWDHHQQHAQQHSLLLFAHWPSSSSSSFIPAERDSGIESAESAQKHSEEEEEEEEEEEDEIDNNGKLGNKGIPWKRRGNNKLMPKMEVKVEEAIWHKGLEVEGGGDRQGCAVCGDVSTGFHYDVSSCNGCKTFFRRTVTTGRKFVCKKGGNCQFDRNGRCACRSCRFRRCVEAGMNERAIQHTPSANLTLSIARKRFKRLQTEMRRGSKAFPSVPPELVCGFETELLDVIGHTLRLEEKLNRLRQSAFSPVDLDLRIGQAVENPTVFGDSDKWPMIQKWPPRPGPEIPCSEYVKLGVKLWMYTDLFLGMEYLKTMDVFRQMPNHEKIAMTKNIIVANQLLTTAHYSHQIRSQFIQYPDGYFPFKNKCGALVPLEKKIIQGMVPAIQSLRPDQVQIALIRTILLLDENCDGISAQSRDQIGQLRSKMCRALLVYLQNKHGQEMGLKQFADSLMFINGLFRRQQVQKNYFIYRHYVLHNSISESLPLFWDFMDELREGGGGAECQKQIQIMNEEELRER